VLTPDVRFEGWAIDDWMRFLALFSRAPSPTPDPRPPGGVVLVHDGGRVQKLLHTRVGRLEPSSESWPVPLEDLAKRHRARWALALHTGALDEVMERFGARAQRGDDLTRQAITLAQLVREMADEGALLAWPTRLSSLRIPTRPMIIRTLDSLSRDGGVIALGLFEGGELSTSIAVRRCGAGFDLVMGPDDLRGAMGLLSGDWRRDYRHLARVIEERAGPLHVGLFTETSLLRALLAENAPGAWARAAAVRDIVLSPISATIAIPLVVDALRGAFHAARSLGERYDPTGTVSTVLATAAPAEPPRKPTLLGALRSLLDRR
jgi:hypothetical protein